MDRRTAAELVLTQAEIRRAVGASSTSRIQTSGEAPSCWQESQWKPAQARWIRRRLRDRGSARSIHREQRHGETTPLVARDHPQRIQLILPLLPLRARD